MNDDRVTETVQANNNHDFVVLFVKEARQRLDAMDAGVRAMAQGDMSPRQVEVIQQGAHQIRGSAMMLELRTVGQLAAALEYAVFSFRDTGRDLTVRTVWVIRDACFALRQLLQLVAIEAPADLHYATLLEQLTALCGNKQPSQTAAAFQAA